MALTPNDVTRLVSQQGTHRETISASTTAAYSGHVFPPGRLLRIVANDGGFVKACQEFVYGNRFGSDTDVDAHELFDGNRDGEEGDLLSKYWDVTDIVTNTPSLDKNAKDSGRSHALEYLLADIDDAINCWMVRGKRSRYSGASRFDKAKLTAGKSLLLRVNKVETFILTAANNKVDIVGGVSGAYTATIPVGTYTWTELAAAMKTQFEAGSTSTFTISLQSDVVRVAFTADETHSFAWATSATPIGATLGFTADDGAGVGPFDADEAQNLDVMEYSFREYRHADANPVKSWDGSAWQNGATSWVEISGDTDGVLTLFNDAITTDEGLAVTQDDSAGEFISGPTTYRLYIRPKADVTDKAALIEDIGVHEIVSTSDNDGRISSNEDYYLETKTWCRVGVVTDGASKTVWVSELGIE
jgi:hypothetical protein